MHRKWSDLGVLNFDDLDFPDWRQPFIECCSDRFKIESTLKGLFDAADHTKKSIYSFLILVNGSLTIVEDHQHPLALIFGGQPLEKDPNLVDLLKAVRPFICSVLNPELQSRLAEMCWLLLPKDFKAGQIAYKAYLESAEQLHRAGNYVESCARLNRAVQLSQKLRLGAEQQSAVCIKALSYLDETPELEVQAVRRWYELLVRYSSEEELGDSLEQTARAYSDRNEFQAAQAILELLGRWFQRRGDSANQKYARLRIAELLVAEARAKSDPFTAKHFAEKAVEAYRAIGGQADQINQLQHWMIELGKNAAASENIHRIRIDVDVKEVQQKYRAASAGHQDYPSAMLAMVRSLVSVLPRRKSVESSVTEESRKYPIRSFAAGTICSSDGRTQAKVPSMPEDPAAFLWSETCSRTVQMLHLSAEAAVVPAREVVWEEHRPSRGEISALLRYSPFVPPSRVDLFAEGFYCGFLGRDYFGAHILLPQVEHSLRVLAEKTGGLTSSLKQDMVQDAHSLNTLLEENSTVASSLGEDLLLNLRALLTERSGSNFRNELLHGLCQPSESRRLDGVSVWYLATILCHGQLLSQPVAAVR